MRRHAVPLVAFFIIILLVGALPAAAQSKCTSQPGGGLMPTCNGAFWVTSAAELADATVLLKVVANDISPINSAAQTINASVCDAQTADDRFGLSIFRLAAPRDIERCVTPASSSAPCTASLVDKPATAASDVSYVVIDVIEEENTASSAAAPNAKFRIAAPGWEKLVVQLVAVENFVNVALGTGTGNCP